MTKTYEISLNDNEWIDGDAHRYWICVNGEWLEVESGVFLKHGDPTQPLPDGHPGKRHKTQ